MINMIKNKASSCAVIIDNLSHSRLLDMNLTKVIPIQDNVELLTLICLIMRMFIMTTQAN